MSELRVLSLWQPHATLCVTPDPTIAAQRAALIPMAPKKYETRHWAPRFPTPFDVVIHATKRWGPSERDTALLPAFRAALQRCGFLPTIAEQVAHPNYEELRRRNAGGPQPLPLGALVGVVTVLKVLTTDDAIAMERLTAAEGLHEWVRRRAADVVHFGDFTPGRFAWWLSAPRPLSAPIPFRGRQEPLYQLPNDVAVRVAEQLGATPKPEARQA